MSTQDTEKFESNQMNGSQVVESIEESSFSSEIKSSTISNGLSDSASKRNLLNSPRIEASENLKIIEHLKSFSQKTNDEKRQKFLKKFTSETSSSKEEEELSELPNTISPRRTSQSNGPDIARMVLNEKKLVFKEEQFENVEELKAFQRSPVGPPKPPMLSRTRSFGIGDKRPNGSIASTPPTPPVTPMTPQPTASPPVTPIQAFTSPEKKPNLPAPLNEENVCSVDKPIRATTITSKTIPEPLKIETIRIEETLESGSPVKEQTELSAPVSSVSSPSMESSVIKTEEKPISAKHYEHLIEELKCPGCATPMKAPILLCETGHSVCEQCTRILMMCPLCKEPFTKQRSLTVEALSSKAHFRCSNASGGCVVRLQKDLLTWHEKQCIYKPMKCFMGRVWGDCDWDGREIQWKAHIEAEHANKVFGVNEIDLIWDMSTKQKPLSGYYVFQVYEEMFNFYEIYDKERILFTMTCTSSIKEKKHHYAYEVTIMHPSNEALAITQKFPVHSEYDKDILMEGTCITISVSDLAKFLDDSKLLHYRVRVLQVNSPRKSRVFLRESTSNSLLPDFQNTQIVGGNLKNVPSEIIVTRKTYDSDSASLSPNSPAPPSSSEDELERVRRKYNRKQAEGGDESESDPEFEAFIAKRWGTPQLHFNRKYLKNASTDCSSNEDTLSPLKQGELKVMTEDDRSSIASTSYKKKVSNTLRKSFRSLKNEFAEIKYFGKKSPDKLSPN